MPITKKEKKQIISHLCEFFVIGLVMGIIEDLLAIHFATDAKITLETVKVAFFVALPFAIISEIIVDSKILHKAISSHISKRKQSQLN